MMSLLSLLIWLVGANVLTFVLFGWDKAQARNGGWRVREATLIFWALIGGWIGAKLGQRVFRHKTRKQPFGVMLNIVGGLLILGMGLLFYETDMRALPVFPDFIN